MTLNLRKTGLHIGHDFYFNILHFITFLIETREDEQNVKITRLLVILVSYSLSQYPGTAWHALPWRRQ